MNMMQFALGMIEKNPQVANNPRNQQMIEVLKSGDEKAGMELATNLCNTYGDSKDEVIKKALGFFNLG